MEQQEFIRQILSTMPTKQVMESVFARLPGPSQCTGCGKAFSKVKMSNIIIPVEFTVGSTPYDAIAPFQCPQEEHWACSPACWAKVAHACIDQHMVPMIEKAYQLIQEEQKNVNSTDKS